MSINRWSKGILVLAALALRLPAQTPSPKLDCNSVLMVVSGMVSTCEIRESAFDAASSLLVNNPTSGAISVYAWDGTQMLVRARILAAAGTQGQAQAVASQVLIATLPTEIQVSGPSTNLSHSWSASLEIYVPASTALHLTSMNGGISVQGISGPVIASSTNGGISISSTGGDITASGINGPISIASTGGNITASGVNGTISISVAGPWHDQTILAKTVNGSVDVAVPSDCAAHVELSTVHGHLSTTIPGVNWTVSGHRGAVFFDLGSGGSLVTATTVNGNVTLRPAD